MSVYDASEIWASNGKDDDHMFGYSEEELEDALDDWRIRHYLDEIDNHRRKMIMRKFKRFSVKK